MTHSPSESIVELRADQRNLNNQQSEDIINPNDGSVIVARDGLINPSTGEKIEAVGITEVRVRSALTCEAPHGICSTCYGADLTTGGFIDIGEAVGIIGAQSIGEPGNAVDNAHLPHGWYRNSR